MSNYTDVTKQNTWDDLVAELEDCVEKDFYFEIPPEGAKMLLEYIRNLESAANDPGRIVGSEG